MLLELIAASATAAATGGTAATALSGSSLTMRNGTGGIDVIQLWGLNQAASGYQEVKWGSAHDMVRGYRFDQGTEPLLAMPRGLGMPINPNETITATIAGAGTAGDVDTLCALIKYGNVPGMNTNAISRSQLVKRTRKMTTVRVSVLSAAAGFKVEGLTDDSNLLIARKNYAVCGMNVNVNVAALVLQGSFTGNAYLGMPGFANNDFGNEFFAALSAMHGDEACVPVLNADDKNNINIGFISDENATTALITLTLAELD